MLLRNCRMASPKPKLRFFSVPENKSPATSEPKWSFEEELNRMNKPTAEPYAPPPPYDLIVDEPNIKQTMDTIFLVEQQAEAKFPCLRS